MADWIVRETDKASENLTEEEAENNVICCWDFLGSLGWTAEAVAGATGNMWAESHVNPGCWEYGQFENFNRGYGLGQ